MMEDHRIELLLVTALNWISFTWAAPPHPHPPPARLVPGTWPILYVNLYIFIFYILRSESLLLHGMYIYVLLLHHPVHRHHHHLAHPHQAHPFHAIVAVSFGFMVCGFYVKRNYAITDDAAAATATACWMIRRG